MLCRLRASYRRQGTTKLSLPCTFWILSLNQPLYRILRKLYPRSIFPPPLVLCTSLVACVVVVSSTASTFFVRVVSSTVVVVVVVVACVVVV